MFKFDILKGEYPITTLRTTALKGAFYDIEAIYIKQTNILEEIHPSIHPWWEDFSRDPNADDKLFSEVLVINNDMKRWLGAPLTKWEDMRARSLVKKNIGRTYGYIIGEGDQMNKLLRGLEKNPFGRRHITDMFSFTSQSLDPVALVPCAYNTMWSIRNKSDERVIDLTLTQRSMDYLMVMSINPAQYVMLGMMVCNHLTFKTGIIHQLGNFMHVVQNLHIYEHPSHWEAAEELLKRSSLGQPTIKLKCGPKDFYEHTVNDFEFVLPEGIKKLNSKLELAI